MVSEAFIRGFIKVLNLFPQKINIDLKDHRKKDCEAIKKDWENIGICTKKKK